MRKINILRVYYWCSILISAFILATVFPKLTVKNFIISIIIMICNMGAGYVDRIIDEEKKKNKYDWI